MVMTLLRGGMLAALVLHCLLRAADGIVASYAVRSYLGGSWAVNRCVPGQCCATVAGGPDQAPNQFALPHGVALETALDGSTVAHVIADKDGFIVQRCAPTSACTVVVGGNGEGVRPADVAVDQAPDGAVLAYVIYDLYRERVMRCGAAVGPTCVEATPAFNTGNADAAVALSKDGDGRASAYIVTLRNGGVQSCRVDGPSCVEVVAPQYGQRKAVVEYAADGSIAAYVLVNTDSHTVVRVAADGNQTSLVVAGFGGQGGGADQLNMPTDVAIEQLSDGTPSAYIVLDSGNQRIQRCVVGEQTCATTVDGAACGATGFQSAWSLAVEQVTVTTTATSSTTTTTTTSSTTLPPAQCTVGNLQCPIIEGQNYTVLGSESSGPPCTLQPGAASNFLSFATSECNTSTIKEAGKETYYATLIPVSRDPIEFIGEGNVLLECRCEVITSADSVTNISDLVNPLEETEVNGSNDFEPVLRAFASDSFTTPLVSGKAVPATKKFFFEVASSSVDDHIGVLNCSTGPSSDENDKLATTLIDEACDSGDFRIRRLESPSKHIVRVETRAFKFRGYPSVHIRCTVERCSDSDATCGSCGAVRRLSSASTSGNTVGLAVASFDAPVSTGDGSILELGETEVDLEDNVHEVSATLRCASALSALLLVVAGCAVLIVAA